MVELAGHLNRSNLRQLLDAHRIDPAGYCLHGGHPFERYVLDERGHEWVVFYSERGLETGLRTFPTEDLACHHLADLLLVDRTIRLQDDEGT